MTAHPAYPDVTLADISVELERELGQRRKVYPQRVASGRMTHQQSAREIGLFAAMRADLDRIAALQHRQESHEFTWHDRRQALQRELALRARHYPQWIDQGRLAADAARRQVRRLEALLAIYDDGFDWRAGNGAEPALWKVEHRTAAEDQALAEWHAHYARVRIARHDPDAAAYVAAVTRQFPALGPELDALLNPPQQEELFV